MLPLRHPPRDSQARPRLEPEREIQARQAEAGAWGVVGGHEVGSGGVEVRRARRDFATRSRFSACQAMTPQTFEQ